MLDLFVELKLRTVAMRKINKRDCFLVFQGIQQREIWKNVRFIGFFSASENSGEIMQTSVRNENSLKLDKQRGSKSMAEWDAMNGKNGPDIVKQIMKNINNKHTAFAFRAHFIVCNRAFTSMKYGANENTMEGVPAIKKGKNPGRKELGKEKDSYANIFLARRHT